MSGSANVTNGGSGEIKSTAGMKLPYPRVSRPSFGKRLPEGESYLTFVKVSKCSNNLYLFFVFGEHDGYIGCINHLW